MVVCEDFLDLQQDSPYRSALDLLDVDIDRVVVQKPGEGRGGVEEKDEDETEEGDDEGREIEERGGGDKEVGVETRVRRVVHGGTGCSLVRSRWFHPFL